MYYKCTKCDTALKLPKSEGRDFAQNCPACKTRRMFARMERIRSGHDYGKDEVFRCMMDGTHHWILSKLGDKFLQYTKIRPSKK